MPDCTECLSVHFAGAPFVVAYYLDTFEHRPRPNKSISRGDQAKLPSAKLFFSFGMVVLREELGVVRHTFLRLCRNPIHPLLLGSCGCLWLLAATNGGFTAPRQSMKRIAVLISAGGCLLLHLVASVSLQQRRVRSLLGLRRTLYELVHSNDEDVTGEAISVDGEGELVQELVVLVDSLKRMNTFVPIGARSALHPSVLSPNDATFQSQWDRQPDDGGSFGDRPLVSQFFSGAEASPLASKEGGSPLAEALADQEAQHVQILLAAIKCPEASAIPPTSRDVSVGVGRSPQGLGSMASSPVARSIMNGSLASPPKLRGLNKSGSPKGSPMSTGLAQRRSQRNASFRPSVPPSVASGPTQHAGAVLVLHVGADGTCEGGPWAATASIPPLDAVESLSAAIGRAISLVSEYGGVVYSFDLTRMVATFHVQRPCVDYALCSVYAGLAISHVFESVAAEGLNFGIGIAVSNMLSGDLGNDEVRSCVVHGAAVEQATDLALLNFYIQTRVLLSEGVHDQVQNNVVTMLVDFVRNGPVLPGSTQPCYSRCSGAQQHSGVFEARGAEMCFEESVGDGIMFASRLPHDILVGYLEAFFYLRKGQYRLAVDRLCMLPDEALHSDAQIQRVYQMASVLAAHPAPPPEYLRSRFSRWEHVELDGEQKSHASPSFAGRKSTHLSHESPTRIIEAVMRARSCPSLVEQPVVVNVESISSTELDHSATCLNLSTTVTFEFADVGGVLWRKSDKLLGKGAFGEVFLGMRVDDGKLVAMKQLRIPEISSVTTPFRARRRNQQREKHELDALVREVKMLCGLRHPNIVFFLGCGVVAQDIIINLEYISGGSLQSVVEEFGCIPIPAAQRYLKDILRGLDFLHGKGIIHRDVKPGNVLLHVDGGCKVTDFGTSIQFQNILDNNIVVGTPLYMSPEQARGSMTTCFQSDLWSVGVMTIQLLTGTLPVTINGAIEAHQYMHRLANDDLFEMPVPDVMPPLAASFVSQCLRRDPMSRGTAEELLLHPFLFSASTPSHPTPLRHKSSTAFSPSPPGSQTSPLSQPSSL